MNRNTSIAEKPRQINKARQERQKQKQRRRRNRLHMLSVALAIVLVVALAVSTVWYSVLRTELNDEISQKREELSRLESESVSLRAQQENSVDLTEVEDYAENVLGLVKLDRSQQEYLELEKTDQVVVSSGSSRVEKLAASFVKSFSAILSFLR